MFFLVSAIFWLLAETGLQNQAHAGPWQGRTEEIDSLLHIFNPGEPKNEPEHISPRELWRLDGNSEETVFGIITSVVADKAGQVYMFDYQLKEVAVVDLNGEIVGRIGREGEGPGEFRQPGGLLVDSQGRIGVLQKYPGKVVMLSSSGEPLQDITFPDFNIPGRQRIREVQWAADRLFITQLSRDRTEIGDGETFNILASIGENETEFIRYEEKFHTRALNDAHYTEQSRKRGQPWVWAVSPEGRVYANGEFDSYEISVHDVEGKHLHTIHREYESLPRPQWHFKELQEYYDEKYEGRVHRGYPMTYEVSRTDPDIGEMFVRQDGSLWVLSSRGSFDKPEGVLGVFDVFDADGFFDHQVFVHGKGDYFTDSFYLSKGLLVVIRNVSVDLSKDGDDEDLKYEVICYQL